MTQQVRRLVMNAVVIPLVVMAILSAGLAWAVREQVRHAAWVAHTDQVLAQANRTQKLLLDMETGMRGFLLTSDGAFLTPYEEARAQIGTAFDVLAALTEGSADQSRRVVDLRAQFAEWSTEAEETIRRPYKRGAEAPDLSREMHERRRHMDAMRGIVGALIADEESRRLARERSASQSNTFTAVSAVVVLVLVATTLLLVTRRNLGVVSLRFEATIASERTARRDAEDAVKVRENFLHMASHELKTPVTSLRLQLESMLRSLEKKGDAAAPDRLERKTRAALRQLARLQELIAALLDVQRLAVTAASAVVRDVDVMLVLHDALARIEHDVRDSGCTITIDGPNRLMAEGDPTRLDQVFTNLLTNAVKYGRRKPVTITLDRTPEKVTIRVRDEGIGISEEDQRRIFERFERAVSDEHFHGFGLGLWIVRNLLESMGGTIRVESARGVGSTFVVELRAAQGSMLDISAEHALSDFRKA
jgi:signal transduction histidine kinase